jgi:hypothetical protein
VIHVGPRQSVCHRSDVGDNTCRRELSVGTPAFSDEMRDGFDITAPHCVSDVLVPVSTTREQGIDDAHVPRHAGKR